MQSCVFCKIVDDEISSHKVYEDDAVKAIMDIKPVQPGMVLVIAKSHVDHFMDMPNEQYQAVMAAVRNIAQHMHAFFPDKRIGVQIEGLDVQHVHIKLIPISRGEQFRAKPTEASPDYLSSMAAKLAF